MARDRTGVEMKFQILELQKRGYSVRGATEALRVSRKTIRKFWFVAEKVAEPSAAVDSRKAWTATVDWDRVRFEHGRGVTVKVLGKEWAPEISYKKFWDEFRRRLPVTPMVTMRLNHKPGERTFFDFADGIDVVDRATGEVRSTEFFCGVLPFSSYTFGEFLWDQKQPTMIASIERAWQYFGGVTPYLTIDYVAGHIINVMFPQSLCGLRLISCISCWWCS